MKSKVLIIIALLSFQVQFTFSQCISVELSVTWKRGHDIFKKDLTVCVPQLNIKYRNISDTNYYFLKVSDSKDGLPMIPYAGSLHPSDFDEYLRWHDDYFGRAKTHGNYANQNFHVRIGGMPLFSEGWFVHSDTLDCHKEHEIDFINSDLANIYEYVHRNNIGEHVEKKLYFSPLDVTPENIFGTVKDQFVFLKPNETHTDTYNLVGFQLIEGRYTFLINQSCFKNYVLVQPKWDNNLSYWIEQKIELPVKVDEYHLYSGLIFTNNVTVDFSERVVDLNNVEKEMIPLYNKIRERKTGWGGGIINGNTIQCEEWRPR